MPAKSALHTLHPVLRRVKSVISFLLAAPLMVVALSAASMSVTSGDASAQERQQRQQRQGAGEFLTAAGRFHARLKALEKKAVMFKPDGVPVRANVTTATRDAGKPTPQPREEQRIPSRLTHRDRSVHMAAIKKLQARVKAFEKEARGHEMGHNLDMPPGAAPQKTPATRPVGSAPLKTPATRPSGSAPLKTPATRPSGDAPLKTPATRPSGGGQESGRSSPGERVNRPSFGAGLDAKSKALDRDITALESEARAIYKKPGRLK